MKRGIVLVAALAALGGGAFYYYSGSSKDATTAGGGRGGRGGAQGGGQGGAAFFGQGAGARMPMTVELVPVRRADLSEQVTVVGNLIGLATVEALPKVAGRIDAIFVRLGDRVTKGQRLAKIEDYQIVEQVKQAEASYLVAGATIRQREADLKLAQTNLDRSKNLFERQLIPKQTFDDTDSRYEAAAAQLDLAKAQYVQAQARIDELKGNLTDTEILSPVSGFVGKRVLDPGAWVTPNSTFISVVDISTVRLVANVVEKDLHRVSVGLRADVEVDALPGDKFVGRVARVSPVLDPATRTAQIEVDIDNPQSRLKPGMYAKVHFTVEHREHALAIPATALVDANGDHAVFTPAQGDQGDFATLRKVQTGLIDGELVEVIDGLADGDRVVTTGAAALREGDRILLPDQNGGRGAAGRAGRGEFGPNGGGRRGAGAASGRSS